MSNLTTAMLRSTGLNSLRSIRSTKALSASSSSSNLNLVSSRCILNSCNSFHTSTRKLAANPQSGKPASDNLAHTVKNIKQEASQVASSIESAVAGQQGGEGQGASGKSFTGDASSPSGTSEILRDAKSITSEMAQKVPQPALLWGAAGIVPYISTGAASIYLARQSTLVQQGFDTTMDLETASALLLHAQNIQVGYGAVILSFLGAIHWGLEFAKYGGEVGNRRYLAGLAPLMLGMPSLLFTPQIALITQWGAYVVAWFIDLKATQLGLAPKWYSTYRFWLTFCVGSSIILTLAGTNYYSTDKSIAASRGAGRKLKEEAAQDASTKMELLKQSAKGNKGGKVTSLDIDHDVKAQSAGEDGDSYVHIKNPKREEEERKQKEEEEKRKAEQQKEKDQKQKNKAETKKEEGEGEGEGQE